MFFFSLIIDILLSDDVLILKYKNKMIYEILHTLKIKYKSKRLEKIDLNIENT